MDEKDENLTAWVRKTIAQFVVARKSLQQHYAVGEKCVINMMELVHSVSDWMIMMIGLGGLLLLFPAWNLQKYLIIQQTCVELSLLLWYP